MAWHDSVTHASSPHPQLEVLRVMATGGIFLFHLWTAIPLSPEAGLLSPMLARIPLLGTVGVIIFNAMAGFVLALPHLGGTSQGHSLAVSAFSASALAVFVRTTI